MFPPQQQKNTHVQLVDGFAPTHPREFRNKHAKKYFSKNKKLESQDGWFCSAFI